MKRFSKILSIVFIISIVLVVLQNSVFATNWDELLNNGTENEILDIEEITTEAGNNNVTNNEVTNNAATNNTVTNVAANNSEADEDLPKTGVTGDIVTILFIAVCGISTVYAYKKIKNYNV